MIYSFSLVLCIGKRLAISGGTFKAVDPDGISIEVLNADGVGSRKTASDSPYNLL